MTEREKRLKEMEKLDRQLEAKGVNTKNRAGEPIEVEKRKTAPVVNQERFLLVNSIGLENYFLQPFLQAFLAGAALQALRGSPA